MSWARFDDRYHDNRKVLRAWKRHPRAVGLHAMSITYCAMHETDGVVDAEWIASKLPHSGERKATIRVLIDVGLWSKAGDDDFQVTDYLDFNRSRQEAEDQRASKKESQRQWREKKRSESCRSSTGDLRDNAPTRPDPTRPTTSTASAVEDDRPEIERLCQLMSDLGRARAEIPSSSSKLLVTDAWRRDMRLLLDRDGRTPDQVEAAIRWVDQDPFWAANVLAPAKLREKFDQLRLAARRPADPAKTEREERHARDAAVLRQVIGGQA